MGVAVKLMGAVDIIAGILIILSPHWVGFDIIAIALFIKGFVSLLS